MSLIRLPDPEQVPPRVKEIFDVVKRREKVVFGVDRISNIYLCQAHVPEYLEVNWQKSRAVMQRGDLIPLVRECVASAVSTVNSCHY